MLKTFKFKALAVAAVTSAGLSTALPAHALVYAVSQNPITNLTLVLTDLNSVVNSYLFTVTDLASLNGTTAANSESCGTATTACNAGLGPVLAAGAVNVGTPTRLDANFAPLGSATGTSYSNANSEITTAELVDGVATGIQQISESLLNGPSVASANTTIQSQTSLTQTVTGGGQLFLDFTGNPFLNVLVQDPACASGGCSAQSGLSTTFQINTGSTLGGTFGSVVFTPTGVAGSDCLVSGVFIGLGVMCTVVSDPFALNGTLPASVNGTNSTYSQSGAFGIRIDALPTSTIYNIALTAGTTTQISMPAPEPGALALVGIALASLGVVARRRQRKVS